MSSQQSFADLPTLAAHLRDIVKIDEPHAAQKTKKSALIFAFNGVGKTQLCWHFKEIAKEKGTPDTLYYNAFTEDLFTWDNDLPGDSERKLELNMDSRFFEGLEALEMENRIRPILRNYADFEFTIKYKEGYVTFSREKRVKNDKGEETTTTISNIKISRGEENIFIWCFFVAVAQLAIDATKPEDAYSWVKYIYVDDPISSLDENNAIAVAHHLAQLLKQESRIKAIVSSHHTLFFNVMSNELGEALKFFLEKEDLGGYTTVKMYKDTARFYHIAMLKHLKDASDSGKLFTYHFAILRNLLEKTAIFHGYANFADCIKRPADDKDGELHKRIINVLNHSGYSLFEPVEMVGDNKNYFRIILADFMGNYRFNPELFPETSENEEAQKIEEPSAEEINTAEAIAEAGLTVDEPIATAQKIEEIKPAEPPATE